MLEVVVEIWIAVLGEERLDGRVGTPYILCRIPRQNLCSSSVLSYVHLPCNAPEEEARGPLSGLGWWFPLYVCGLGSMWRDRSGE